MTGPVSKVSEVLTLYAIIHPLDNVTHPDTYRR